MQFFSLTSCTQILLFSDLWMPRLQTIWYYCLVTCGQTTSQKCSELAPSFFSPDLGTLLVSYGSVSTYTHSLWHWVSHFSRRVFLFPAMTTRSRPARRLQSHLAKPSVECGVSSALCSKSLPRICHPRPLESQRNGVPVSHYNVGLCHRHSSPLRSRVTDYVIFLSYYMT